MNYVKYKKYWNTKHITQLGQSWYEDKFYCPFPEGTNAYDEFWDEQESYIMDGFMHEGERIPGLQYLYSNFAPIWNKKEKNWLMPDFRTVDCDWFLDIEEAMGIGPWRTKEERFNRDPVHITAKARQTGHSLKGVIPLLYNMHWQPGSRNFIGAYQKGQAQKTNAIYQAYHRHLYEYTAWGKRWLRKEEGEEYLTGYQDQVKGQWIDAGFLSYLKIVGFADGFPEKAVGGGVDLFILEEIGVFPGLIGATNFLLNSVKDGDLTTGSIIGYGAAGSLQKAADLHKMAYNPEAYSVKGYENIYDENAQPGKKVVKFIPNYSCRRPYMDEDGNPDQEAAIIAKEKSLKELKMVDYETYLERASQDPNSLKEMFSVRQRKRFDSKITDPHVAWLEAREGQLSDAVELYMDFETNKVKYRITDKLPIRDYPIDPKMKDKTGCVEMYELPHPNPPRGMYIASIDSYNQQESTTTSSLGHIIIYKTATGMSGEALGRIIVAEYYGRPDDKHDFYRTCLYLQLLYNAIALHENEDQELTPWYYNKGFEHMLADQPEIILQHIPNSKAKRTKGIHAVWPLIKAADNKIERYLTEQLGIIYDSEGHPISEKLGISRIPSLGIAREIAAYISDPDMNFDRIRTLGWLFMYEEETFLEPVSDANATSAAAMFLNNTARLTGVNNILNTPLR